jgi:hypothetical protein
MTKQMKSERESTKRRNSAVSTANSLTQRARSESPPQTPAGKTYRRSTVSRTVRVPNELIPRVNAMVAEYREYRHNDPDTWK